MHAINIGSLIFRNEEYVLNTFKSIMTKILFKFYKIPFLQYLQLDYEKRLTVE